MASTAEIELSVKHDDSEDESSSDSDDDEQSGVIDKLQKAAMKESLRHSMKNKK